MNQNPNRRMDFQFMAIALQKARIKCFSIVKNNPPLIIYLNLQIFKKLDYTLLNVIVLRNLIIIIKI